MQLKSGVKSLAATSRNIQNNIFHWQNDKLLLQFQMMQRAEYAHAKKKSGIKEIIIFTYAIASVIASFIDIDWVSALLSLIATVLVIANKYLDEHIQLIKQHAASVQQYIDVELYSKALEMDRAEWGGLPTKTELVKAVLPVVSGNTFEVQDWYSDYSTLSCEEQVFYCQRENVRWNYDLLNSFKRFEAVTLSVVCAVMLGIFIKTDITFTKILCFLAWIAPIAEYAYSEHKEINKSIELLTNIDKLCNEIERDFSKNPSEIKKKLINLQYRIKEKRELGYLIPDWFYRLKQPKQQIKEDNMAEKISNLDDKFGDSE